MQEQVYRYHAEFCQALAHPKRLEIIDCLGEGEKTVTELSQLLHISQANLSQHLALMRDRKVLATRKEGNIAYYRLSNPKLLKACQILKEILIEQIRHDASLVKTL